MPLLFIDNWFDNAFIQALGWTLLHSLWQGFLLVVLVSLTIFLTRRSTATIRYRIFSTLFYLFLGTTIITFIIEYSSLRSIPTAILLTGNEPGDSLTLSSNPHTAADLNVPFTSRLAFYFNAYGPWLMLLWFIVFLLKSIRLGINYGQVQRLRNENRYFLPDIEKRVNELAKLLHIRRTVKLRETTSITVPVTIGFLKPLILVPFGLINNLPPDQVEAILLHELAHIRRMDYLVNLFQCLAETIFFFNPAVLWLSSLLREERENCCDDIAITVTQNKSLFIHALVAFQEYHAGHPMAPGLTGSKYPLLERIQRIVYNTNKKLNHMEKIFLALGLVVTGFVALAFTTPKTHKEKAAQSKVSQQPITGSIIKDTIPATKSRSFQKRSEEGLLLEKVLEDKNRLHKFNEQERQLLEESLKKINEIDEKALEFFNESKKMDLQDKFMKELQFNKEQQNLLKDKITKNNEQLFFNEQQLFKKLMQDRVAQELFKDANEKIFNQDFKIFDEKDKQSLLKDKMESEKDFKEMLDKIYDTVKPRKALRPKNPDGKGDDYESRQEYIKERKRELENELKEKEREDKEDYNSRMREMAEYRAMLQKELRQTESRIEKEKKNAEHSRKEAMEERGRMEKRGDERGNRGQDAEKRAREQEERMEDNKKREYMEREKRENNEEDKRERKERDKREYKEVEKRIEKDREKRESKESKDRDENDDKRESKSSSSKENIKIESKDGKEKIDVKMEERRAFNSNDNALLRNQNSNLAKERTAKRRADVEELRKESADRRKEMIRELKEDDIIPEDANEVNIHIDDDKMIVNGVQQPENVHKKYLDKFKKESKKPTAPGPANKPVKIHI